LGAAVAGVTVVPTDAGVVVKPELITGVDTRVMPGWPASLALDGTGAGGGMTWMVVWKELFTVGLDIVTE
jgi:hypothetical protein